MSYTQVLIYIVVLVAGAVARHVAPAAVKRLPKPRRKPPALARNVTGVVMWDDVTVSLFPRLASTSPDAVAGYRDGRFANEQQLARAFPNHRHLWIVVNAADNADCLDIERGDATPAQAPTWVKRQHARGVKRPVLYCSISAAPAVLEQLAAAGIHRPEIRLWSAHYTGRPHICGPQTCGFSNIVADATQWTSRAFNRDLDESLCSPDFFTG